MIDYDSPLDLPVSLMLALWAPVPSSFGLSVVQGPDGAHQVRDGESLVSLEEWLAAMRPFEYVAAVLPAAGEFAAGYLPALEAGEGVIMQAGPDSAVPGRSVILAPYASGTSVLWEASELPHSPTHFDPSHARRRLTRATEEAIQALIELDLARERPVLADELNDIVTAVLDPRLMPPGLDARRQSLLEKALRLKAICDIALEDDGAAASAAQVASRLGVLRELHGVAREGMSAASQYVAPR